MTEERIATIVARVQQAIPTRPRPPLRPRKSWKGMKVGDKWTGAHNPGTLVWEVESCDTEGANLRVVVPFRAVLTNRIDNPEQLVGFVKVKKPRARKTPTPST